MAVLSDSDRADLWAEFMRELSRDRDPVGVMTKADLRAAVNAIDDYLNTNASAINTAIPQPARGVLTTAQKARLLKAVVTQRYIKGA